VRVLLAAVSLALLVPAAAFARSQVHLEDTVPSGGSSAVTFTTHKAASFSVLLRVPTAGRAKLFLTGPKAPKGINPLIRTSNTSGQTGQCQGAAGSFYCKAAYEALPKGTYTWRVSWTSTTRHGPKMPAHVELTVRW